MIPALGLITRRLTVSYFLERLKEQEKYLDQHVVGGLSPILSLSPDKAKGEVFPAIWYSSTMALTGMQHHMVAKMILTAESPFLGYTQIYPMCMSAC